MKTKNPPPHVKGESKPLFEVEIHTGNRAAVTTLDRAAAIPEAEGRAITPLAAQRRERTRLRARLFGVLGSALLAGLVVWGTAVWWQPLLEGSVVARVNGEAITFEQVDREIRLSKAISVAATGKEQAPAPPSMLEQIILTEAKVQAARSANFSVTDQEVDQELSDLARQAGTTQGKIEASLQSYGLTGEDLRASIAKVALVNRFVERYVIGGVADRAARLDKVNRWQTDVVQLARVERLRSPVAGFGPRVGSQAPDFALKVLNGKEIRLSSLRGRSVMINFWAPWCPPCRAEMPVLEQSYKGATGNSSTGGFELLGVATQSEPDNVAAFAREFGVTFPVLLDNQNEVTDLYRVGPIPTSYFIDKEGIIRAVQIGQLNEATLAQRLQLAR